jgi:hypothetical protein
VPELPIEPLPLVEDVFELLVLDLPLSWQPTNVIPPTASVAAATNA